mgnify:CR=1 FL=1
MIYLIPKGTGETQNVQNWRPIAILNTIYKIYANVLAQRIKSFMPDLIQINQTSFMSKL